MKIKIARIKEEDIKEAYRFCMGIFNEMEWDKRFAYELKNLKDFFKGSREVFFLAKKGHKIIGCGGLKELSKNKGLIKRFYMAQEFRGEGLAEEMLKKIKQFAKKEDYKTLVLDIFENKKDNIRAKRFFQKQSFIVFNPKPEKNWRETGNPELFEFRKLDLK